MCVFAAFGTTMSLMGENPSSLHVLWYTTVSPSHFLISPLLLKYKVWLLNNYGADRNFMEHKTVKHNIPAPILEESWEMELSSRLLSLSYTKPGLSTCELPSKIFPGCISMCPKPHMQQENPKMSNTLQRSHSTHMAKMSVFNTPQHRFDHRKHEYRYPHRVWRGIE